MCQSKADGGQRCFGHAKVRYDRALARYSAAQAAARSAFVSGASFDRVNELRDAEKDAGRLLDKATADLISTPRGPAYLQELAEADAARRAQEEAAAEAARTGYEQQARLARARAAALGHTVRVDTPRRSSDGGPAKATASCSACGRLGQSVVPAAVEMSANVHAGQIADAADRAAATRPAEMDVQISSHPDLQVPTRTCTRCGDTTAAGCEDWDCHRGWGGER